MGTHLGAGRHLRPEENEKKEFEKCILLPVLDYSQVLLYCVSFHFRLSQTPKWVLLLTKMQLKSVSEFP